jgi:hypothetical protein
MLFLVVALAAPGLAVPGDCDGDSFVTSSDVLALTAYMANGTPVVSYIDCDCDGFPGLNFADLQHLVWWVATHAAPLVAYPGTDLIILSDATVSPLGSPDGVTTFQVNIFVDCPSGIGGGFTLPFSFAPKPGESDLDCTNVTTGPHFTAVASIDNPAKSFLIRSSVQTAPTSGPVLLCQATFALTPGGSGAGNPVCVKPHATERYFPMLLKSYAYTGVDFVRVQFPRVCTIPGDVDCSGFISISDAVYIIMYILGGGPLPCHLCL